MPIREVERNGETKKPEREDKEKEEASGRKRGWLVKQDLGAKMYGAMLGANDPGAILGANDPGAMLGARPLGAMLPTM
jgi:hypothetical protein